ncbi:hypothetical protein [Dyadobacter sp. BHUBP1]|uniref:hypothetical protein n=1 Tax=Dyadobacter sp. BHUBP1 TaxID=3424178 RepID=UPI003D343687
MFIRFKSAQRTINDLKIALFLANKSSYTSVSECLPDGTKIYDNGASHRNIVKHETPTTSKLERMAAKTLYLAGIEEIAGFKTRRLLEMGDRFDKDGNYVGEVQVLSYGFSRRQDITL